ncbi:MAG TPA: AIR synthase related protein, partial [Candidatus Sulfotelmatobacter sp.]|nr:AIR synthase related protein [Candidatus Sulfotelmatobacter sp.]
MDKLEICKHTRKIAAESLYKILKKLLAANKPISEVMLRDAWLTEMQKNIDIFHDGWYTPPPYGIIVLFATDQQVERINYKSARPQEKWPRDDIFLNQKNGIVYFYASPVDKKTGIIGDFGLTLYFGNNPDIKNLLKKCLELNKELFTFLHVGMTLGSLSSKAEILMKKNGMSTDSEATTDVGEMVIGHTIPDAFEDWEEREKLLLKNKEINWHAIKKIISHKRVNVKKNESLIIKQENAVTIEPRPKIIDKPYLPTSLSYHTIALLKKDESKELLTNFDELFTLAGMSYMIEPMKKQKISYQESGVDYDSLDPAKTLAQKAGKQTAKHLTNYGFSEISDTRGESAFVWKQKNTYMASVTESLGTKNLIADAMREITNKTYYENIGYDTVASALNDLASVGAKPLTVFAFWAVGKSSWFDDIERTTDLVNGWKQACDDAQATWGGGESPSYNNIVNPETIALGSSVVGIIKSKKRLLLDKNVQVGDRILLLKSSGINANGISLSRAVAKKLPKGYATELPNGKLYGEEILTKTHIYASLIKELFDAGITIHYISNITGHGLRKVMRGRGTFTYILEKIFDPQEIFLFIQKYTGLSDYEMYETYNMGQDYVLFLPKTDSQKALR